MLGPTADWRSRDLAERSSILEPPHQSQPSHHPVGLYSEKGPIQVRLQNHAVTVLVGVARPDVEIGVNIFNAIGGQKRVQGVNFGSTNFKRDIPMYAELYLQGRMNLDDLVSRRISLREVNEGYAALKDGSLNRVVVTSF